MNTMNYIMEALVANGKILTFHAQAQQMAIQCRSYCGMLDKLDAIKNSSSKEARKDCYIEGENMIGFHDVQVSTPTIPPRVLVDHLTWELPHGESLLLTGHNGAGKSSIFRCLGELWPITQGRIQRPGVFATPFENLHNIFYVPQRPYLSMGTIADQVTARAR